jgi:hypothetical protein
MLFICTSLYCTDSDVDLNLETIELVCIFGVTVGFECGSCDACECSICECGSCECGSCKDGICKCSRVEFEVGIEFEIKFEFEIELNSEFEIEFEL